jgi:integrase
LPESIGPFRILGLLGEGGMGRVYRALERTPPREVALKVAGLPTRGALERFQREIELLAQLDSYRSRSTARALEFLILTAARTGEIRFATWDEFSDLDRPERAVWDIPASRMKMKRPHRVFLSPEAVQLLREQADGPWPRKGLVFPINGQAASENALLNVLDRYGWKGRITVHGFRGTFSTHCNEHLKPVDVVEACLAHEERSATRRAYNHAQLEKHRRDLMNWWAAEVMRRKRVAVIMS